MPLKGALVGWQGSSRAGGGILTGAERISLERYPENWLENIYWSMADYARIRAGVGFPRVQVGPSIDRRDIPVPTLPEVPGMGPTARREAQSISPISVIGREKIPDKGELSVVKVISPIPPPVRSSPTPEKGVGLPKTGDDVPSVTELLRDLIPGNSRDIFDVGANLYDIYNQFSGPGGTPPYVPNQDPPGPGTTDPPITPPGGPMAIGCERDPSLDYVLKYVCGEWKWIKKRKRRRKRLATSSDIKDLSSLKGVLGGGKSFDLWIATHAS